MATLPKIIKTQATVQQTMSVEIVDEYGDQQTQRDCL